MSGVPAAAPQPESQEDILQAALAALAEADILPEDGAWFVPDPDCDPPAELADMSDAELEELGQLPTAASAVLVSPAWPLSYPALSASNGHVPHNYSAAATQPGPAATTGSLNCPAPAAADGLVKPPGRPRPARAGCQRSARLGSCRGTGRVAGPGSPTGVCWTSLPPE